MHSPHAKLLIFLLVSVAEQAGYYSVILSKRSRWGRERLLSCGCLYSVCHPRGAVGWSVIVAIPGHILCFFCHRCSKPITV